MRMYECVGVHISACVCLRTSKSANTDYLFLLIVVLHFTAIKEESKILIIF